MKKSPTGRSVEPNLQRFPLKTKLGEEIRRASQPKSGTMSIQPDFSQLELRVMADLAEKGINPNNKEELLAHIYGKDMKK